MLQQNVIRAAFEQNYLSDFDPVRCHVAPKHFAELSPMISKLQTSQHITSTINTRSDDYNKIIMIINNKYLARHDNKG